MKRDVFIKLKEWKNKKDRKPLILKGARQVGKTYILKYFGQQCFEKVHYLNFEKQDQLSSIFDQDFNPDRILDEISFSLNQEIDKEKDLIIFDEVQNSPKALTSLKYFQEEMPGLAICCAGSLLGVCLCEESFPVGKIEFLDMYPMSFCEFLLAIEDVKSYNLIKKYNSSTNVSEVVHKHLWDKLKIYFIVGGLPEIVKTYIDNKDNLIKALTVVREKQNNLIIMYQADMAKHSGKQNAMQIERLWRNVPAQLAMQQDGSSAKFKFRGVIPGINRYSRLVGSIDWLQAAGLIIKVSIINKAELPFMAHAKDNSFKLYLFDIGLLGALSDLPINTIMEYNYGTYKCYYAENFVAQEFICAGYKNLHCWAERTSEVEFVLEVDGDILPIEVKSGWNTRSRSLASFVKKYSPKYRTIMSANNFKIDGSNKVHRYPLYLASKFPLKG